MTEGLAWIPGTDSSLIEALNSIADDWLVECSADFPELYSQESCRERRASSFTTGTQNSATFPISGESSAPEHPGVERLPSTTRDALVASAIDENRNASLVFRTQQQYAWGSQYVAFWRVTDRNLAREIMWANAISGWDGLVSCMISGDCDPSLLQQLALNVDARRGFVDGGLLLEDSWEELAASCKLAVWFGRPDWDFAHSVLLTSAQPGVLDGLLSSATSAGAKMVPGFSEAISYWSRDRRSSCVCKVDIGAELARHA
jgi:hypothetical protein